MYLFGWTGALSLLLKPREAVRITDHRQGFQFDRNSYSSHHFRVQLTKRRRMVRLFIFYFEVCF